LAITGSVVLLLTVAVALCVPAAAAVAPMLIATDAATAIVPMLHVMRPLLLMAQVAPVDVALAGVNPAGNW
jgi:hypothetical protein